MKTIFRFLSTGVLTAAIVAVAATAGFGQDAAATPSPSCADIDGHNALYTKFTGVYNKKALPDMESALSTGKEYLEKYGTCTEAFKEQIDFVKPHVVRLEAAVKRARMVARYDAAVQKDDPAEIVSAGKEFIELEPENINIVMPMALASSYKSTKENNYKYSDDAIRYANLALNKIKGGWTFNKKDKSGVPTVGVFQYELTKEAAIGELTYAIAYNTYYGKKDKKAALPLYYELSQSGPFKTDPRIYGTIGEYYVEQGGPIGDEIAKLIQQIKESTDDKVKEDLDGQVKAKIALFNGYLERSIDAFGRAHSVAKPGPYKDSLYKQLQILYKRRTDKDTGLDPYIATMIAKPFPNPTTPVTPVSDPEPATTTGGTAAPAATAPASTTAAKPPTKPMSTTGSAKTSVAKKGTR